MHHPCSEIQVIENIVALRHNGSQDGATEEITLEQLDTLEERIRENDAEAVELAQTFYNALTGSALEKEALTGVDFLEEYDFDQALASFLSLKPSVAAQVKDRIHGNT